VEWGPAAWAVVAVLAMVIIMAIAAWCNWEASKGDFWRLKLVDFISPVAALLVGVLLANLFSSREAKQLHKSEILERLAICAQETCRAAVMSTYSYVRDPSRKREREVLTEFQNLSRAVGLLRTAKITDATIPYEPRLSECFFELKATATDSPFGQDRPSFTEERARRLERLSANFDKEFLRFRLAIYS